MAANLAMGSNKITGLANGTAATDAVSLGQADAKYAGLAAANTFTAVQGISVNTTTPALKVTQAGTGNVLELLDVAGDTTPFTIDASGCAISGHTAVIPTIGKFGTNNNPAIEIVAANGSAFAIHQYVNSGVGPTIIGMKSRGATIGAAGAMLDGDSLLSLLGCSSGTTALNLRACGIWFESDGVSTDTSSPGRLLFNTTPASAVVPVERLRIAATGAFGLSGANYGTAGQVLTSAGNAAPPTWSTLVVDASDSAKGIVELATVAETRAGADTVRAVTPAGLGDLLPKAWGRFTNAGVKVSGSDFSVVKTDIGRFTVTLGTALADADYAVMATALSDNTGFNFSAKVLVSSSSSFIIRTGYEDTDQTSDPSQGVTFVIFR
jgi:hypothetical protein